MWILSNAELRVHLMALSLFPSYFDGTAAAEVMGLQYDEAEDGLGELLELNIVRFLLCFGFASLLDSIFILVLRLISSPRRPRTPSTT